MILIFVLACRVKQPQQQQTQKSLSLSDCFGIICDSMKIPLFKRKYSGQRSFSYQGPVTWNNLLFSIRHTQTDSSFKSHWKPTCFPKPSNRTQFLMLFVFDFQSWDVSMVHVLLHCMSGLHWLFRDVCMFACALLLTMDRLVCACFMYWFWCPFLFWIVKCFEPVKLN